MPDAEGYSWTTYDETVEKFISVVSPKTVLDIGAGSGKYADIIRKIDSNIQITGVELSQDSITQHKLNDKYDDLISLTSDEIITKMPMLNFDVVILGDVIEHFKKSAGIDLINWLLYRSSYIVIVVPEAMPMSIDPWYEGHNSIWTERDFIWHDNWSMHQIGQAQLFILRGHNSNKTSLSHVVNALNDMKIALSRNIFRETLNLVHFNSVRKQNAPGDEPGQVFVYTWRNE